MSDNTEAQEIIRDLGDGLVLRSATAADAQALAGFSAHIHGNRETGEPDDAVAAWVMELATLPHPTFRVSDFTLVEDTRHHRIISSLCLIPQVWTYAGIPFGVGRPELVGTLPEYRKRGLIRAQFEVIHRWSAERGHRMQAITGIPYYYRQFGYEMAMDLGGGRTAYPPQVPKLREGEAEPYRVRPATEVDLPFVAEVYRQAIQRKLIACPINESVWRYELQGRHPRSVHRHELRIIEAPQGEPVGYLAHRPKIEHGAFGVGGYELKRDVSWLAVTPSILRYMASTAQSYGAQEGTTQWNSALGFWLGSEHPVYEAFSRSLPQVQPPYAWYIRIPDLAGFLRHLAPALESRLVDSLMPGHSGDLKLSFYRRGLRLVFERGHLVTVENWDPASASASAAFPDHTFIKLVVGYATAEELRNGYPDCWVGSDEARVLLNTLFPKQTSHLWIIA
jgi:GNAT superfamily N-acetyltransferase